MAPIKLKIKGNRSFLPFSHLDSEDELSKTWRVCTKVKDSLEDGSRLENLSWRLWFVHSVVVDEAKAHSAFKKMSTITTRKLEREISTKLQKAGKKVKQPTEAVKTKSSTTWKPSTRTESAKTVKTVSTMSTTKQPCKTDKHQSASNSYTRYRRMLCHHHQRQKEKCQLHQQQALQKNFINTKIDRLENTRVVPPSHSGGSHVPNYASLQSSVLNPLDNFMEPFTHLSVPDKPMLLDGASMIDNIIQEAWKNYSPTHSGVLGDKGGTDMEASAIGNLNALKEDSASFDVDVTLTEPSLLPLQCYQSSSFYPTNDTVSMMDPTLNTSAYTMPTTVTRHLYESTGYDTTTAIRNNTSMHDANMATAQVETSFYASPPLSSDNEQHQHLQQQSQSQSTMMHTLSATGSPQMAPSGIPSLAGPESVRDTGTRTSPGTESTDYETESPICSNCKTTHTPLWRRSSTDHLLCNACGLYWRLHQAPRPYHLKVPLVRKTKKDGETTSVPEYVCSNCSATTTPLWRRDRDGSPLCNACGLYLKLHHEKRPISMRSDIIRKRRRFDNTNTVTHPGKKITV
ncbi:uncharacterized protein BYT42DRAFT_616129 [Radiomyces spectabilis]|uniref:uncharacterized protein n=1 Tax=Radiomyces spectabilis TaxID=64574 RepID=UPI00221E73FC|nr:uncharacterized protein BYT42DRAFT_616129 [Radiomyces spectabilis]KAI8372933.1 hypothetical protein BYT42DRAFT_616129 [Radiomyces spectabilis]